MAKYNSGSNYNDGVLYNSASYFIIEVSEVGYGQELLSIISNLSTITDSGTGTDSIGNISKFDADSYFIVTTEGRMEPLGVIVLRDSRHELMPSTRDISEEIPGRHGEIDFGTEFKKGLLELKIATDEGLSVLEREQLKRKIAKYLNPKSGTKKLIFEDDDEVQYEVKYSGKIDLTKYSSWMEFTIPFKMSQPFMESVEEHSQTGEGVIINNGTEEAPVQIEIPGPATNPGISIGATVVSYASSVPAGQTLVIDTGAQTAKIGSIDAVAELSDDFPTLSPQEYISVVPSVSTITVKWRDRWI